MRPLARDLHTIEPAPTIVDRSNWPTEFSVPVEMVLACTTSVMKAVIEKRRANGDFAHPIAKVFVRIDRFFAVVSFGTRHLDLLVPLDVWPWEHGR